jgi:hypothetical protein
MGFHHILGLCNWSHQSSENKEDQEKIMLCHRASTGYDTKEFLLLFLTKISEHTPRERIRTKERENWFVILLPPMQISF